MKGTFHKLSAKHLPRYANEFAGRQNIRELDTIDQMVHFVAHLVGERLMYWVGAGGRLEAAATPHSSGLDETLDNPRSAPIIRVKTLTARA
ncbi:MAG: hypothetical protein OXT72_03390 [Gammaproteobacteria bacterium]|nr:hypothetical protein [Gammaproteobacteria bacterium]MDE0246844.1 hypothetical protein [Gammaproteobacteria bacterium]